MVCVQALLHLLSLQSRSHSLQVAEHAATSVGNAFERGQKRVIKPWPIAWTAQNTADFWQWVATAPSMRDDYFAGLRGRNSLRVVKRYASVASPVLDLGAGTGGLTQLLLDAGHRTIAAETSEETVQALRTR